MSTRRQLSLLLPEPERSLVDEVRARFDPKQHALIPAHVTLCREAEVDDWSALWTRVETLGARRLHCELGEPMRLADGCVLMWVSESAGRFDALRARLLGEECSPSRPHVTLLHPRNAGGKEAPFEAIQREPLPRAVSLGEVSMIEQKDHGRWATLARHVLAGATESEPG